ncbi:histidinol phosphate aminotransferase [Pseudophaeobacter sp.]|uniref:histidinol phosphate aminotransferase n=1 Tax=Pseudophaeobacter sp. TaxID=1971739 RepID=UPI003297692F
MYDDKGTGPNPNSPAPQVASIDLFAAALSFIGLNLMWIFFVGWVLFGMIPVLVLALVLNHLIDRLEDHLNEGKT